MPEVQSSLHDSFSTLDWDGWLARRRWFVRRPGTPSAVLEDVIPLGPGMVSCFVRVGEDLYFAPLSSEREKTRDGMRDASGTWWFDGLLDSGAVEALLGSCLGAPTRGGRVELASRVLDGRSLEASLGGAVRLGTAEQTNSWALCGDSFVKVFRKLDFARNLDVETLEGLASRRDLSIPRLRAVLEALSPRGTAVVAAVQEAIAHERNAWEEACAAVASVAAGERAPVDGWGVLGRRVAELHAAMSEVFGVEALAEGRREGFGSAAAALARDVVSELAASKREGWPEAVVRDAEAFADRAEGLHALFAGAAPAGLPLQRVHGDLHLGQILSRSGDWTIIDFEGEPARPAHERAAFAHVAKDVAGMLRSFDYACRAGLPEGADPAAAARARAWRETAREAFLDGYFGVERVATLWPELETERSWLLSLHEAEKAFYELRYELRHRPDWMGIPLGGLLALSAMER